MSRSTLSIWLRGLPRPPRKQKTKLLTPDVVRGIERPNLSKTDIGEAARQLIIARLMFANLSVFRPITEDTPVDLLVLTEAGKALKCQCKCMFQNKNGSHTLSLITARKSGPGKKVVVHKYTEKEVDFFIGYCIQTDSVYIFPFSTCAGKRVRTLWLCNSPRGKNDKDFFDSEPWRNAFHLLRS